MQYHIQFLKHHLRVFQNIIVPKSDDTHTCRFNDSAPFFIIQSLLIIVMSATVKLDGKSCLMAVKVQDVSMKRYLSTEFEAAETTIPDDVPQQIFSICLAFAQLPGKCKYFLRYRQRSPPHPPLRGTFSLEGEGIRHHRYASQSFSLREWTK